MQNPASDSLALELVSDFNRIKPLIFEIRNSKFEIHLEVATK